MKHSVLHQEQQGVTLSSDEPIITDIEEEMLSEKNDFSTNSINSINLSITPQDIWHIYECWQNIKTNIPVSYDKQYINIIKPHISFIEPKLLKPSIIGEIKEIKHNNKPLLRYIVKNKLSSIKFHRRRHKYFQSLPASQYDRGISLIIKIPAYLLRIEGIEFTYDILKYASVSDITTMIPFIIFGTGYWNGQRYIIDITIGYNIKLAMKTDITYYKDTMIENNKYILLEGILFDILNKYFPHVYNYLLSHFNEIVTNDDSTGKANILIGYWKSKRTHHVYERNTTYTTIVHYSWRTTKPNINCNMLHKEG